MSPASLVSLGWNFAWPNRLFQILNKAVLSQGQNVLLFRPFSLLRYPRLLMRFYSLHGVQTVALGWLQSNLIRFGVQLFLLATHLWIVTVMILPLSWSSYTTAVVIKPIWSLKSNKAFPVFCQLPDAWLSYDLWRQQLQWWLSVFHVKAGDDSTCIDFHLKFQNSLLLEHFAELCSLPALFRQLTQVLFSLATLILSWYIKCHELLILVSLVAWILTHPAFGGW